MVELFTPAGFAGSARSGSPVPPVARLEAPHASQVKRTERLESPGQDFSPALKHDGPGFYSSQGMSASPLFEMYRIECRDYSERMKRVRITPTSLRRTGRARLRASSSTEQPRGGWLIRPLSRAGKAQFTGRGRQSNYALQSSFGPTNLRRDLR